ncbi:MAG: tail fiber domain-containing protein [Phaeodactylibacter sp.]|nr:tail fiber domain-containing protein [Phaeodactylibacter sp.]
MYVASAGTSRIFLDSDNGNISITGNLYGDVVGNADSSTKVTTTTNGSSSYYDILAHGLTGTGQGASTPTRAASGKLTMRPSDGKIKTTGNIEVGGLVHAEDGFTSNGYARLAGTVTGSNHHRGSYGTYVTTDRIHPIWGINVSWKLDSDGLGAGKYYGLSHIHTTGYGGDASSSSGASWATFVNGRSQSQGVKDCKYAIQWTSNGDCKSLFGEAIWSQGNITTESNMIATGDITAGGSVYGTIVSDRSTKNTILAISDASEKVSLLSGNSYYYNEDRGIDGLQYGLIAQEIQTVLPEMVAEDSDGILRIKTGGLELTALLVEAHKEVSAKVDAQAELIENMMSRLEALENKS